MDRLVKGLFVLVMPLWLTGCPGGGEGQGQVQQNVNGAGQALEDVSLKLTADNKTYEMSPGGNLRGETTDKNVIPGGGNAGTSTFVDGERRRYGDAVPQTYIPAGDMSNQVRHDQDKVTDFTKEEAPMTVQDLENSGIPIQKMR